VDSIPPIPAAHTCRLQIETLIAESSREEIIDGLKKILAGYGKVVSVEVLPAGSKIYAFLVDFENTQDAIAASQELDYLLFGHSTMVIHVAPKAL
jgi:hypothetical protein